MKVFRSSVLVVLALVSAAVVVVSPAFATPNITASSGTSPVAPFITPIGNTRSQWTGRATSSFTLDLPAVPANVTCRSARFSSYYDVTHTQERITVFDIGDGIAGTCTATIQRGAGTVDRDRVQCITSSTTPWFFHVKQIVGGTSANGHLIPTTACGIIVTVGRTISCNLSINAGQSIPYVDTWTSRTLAINGSATVAVRSVANCLPTGPQTGTLTVIYSYVPDTVADRKSITSRS
jgi:hypothetical protein